MAQEIYEGEIYTGPINSAHSHFDREGLYGSLNRLTIENSIYTEDQLCKDLDKYRVEKAVIFPQPHPTTGEEDIARVFALLGLTGAITLPDIETKLAVMPVVMGAIFFKMSYESITGKLIHFPINYSKANDRIYELKDDRVEFVPFVGSNFKPADIERFEGIKGVKFYEPYGAIPENLLRYLDEHELNMIIHLSIDMRTKPIQNLRAAIQEAKKSPSKKKVLSVLKNTPSVIFSNPSYIDVRKPEEFLKKVARYDGINFQVAHWAYGNKEITDALDEHSYLFLDSSGSTWPFAWNFPYKEIARKYPEKIVFGPDEPWCKYEPELNVIKGLGLDKNDQRKILYENYSKLW